MSVQLENYKMKKILIILISLLSLTPLIAQQVSENVNSSRPSSHAPIGVMGDHTHDKGEWMFSYRFMQMNMENLKQGSNDVPFSSALQNYLVTPTRMPMRMQMLGVMYAPTNRLTIAIMLSYSLREMDHVTRMGGRFTTNSSGIGDSKIAGIYRLIHTKKSKLHVETGLFIPTGSIQNDDIIPASEPNSVILPYPMQIGSGTWDPTTALTYLLDLNKFGFGAQGRVLLRTGINENEYRLGNQYEITAWSSYNLTSWLGFSARLQAINIDQIKGENPALNPAVVITADTNNSGGEYLNGSLGLNILFPQEILSGLRLALEVKRPLYQNLNGFQLKQNNSMTIGIQYGL